MKFFNFSLKMSSVFRGKVRDDFTLIKRNQTGKPDKSGEWLNDLEDG